MKAQVDDVGSLLLLINGTGFTVNGNEATVGYHSQHHQFQSSLSFRTDDKTSGDVCSLFSVELVILELFLAVRDYGTTAVMVSSIIISEFSKLQTGSRA